MSRARPPHAYPFVLLDRIIEIQPGVRAVATRQLTRDDPLVDADGCLPPALLAETLAQCAGVAVHGVQAGDTAVVARINRFRSRLPVHSGMQLRVVAQVVKVFGATAKVRGVVRADGRRCAAGEVVLSLRVAPDGSSV
jgi:3-hydroxyacyl-[acyl-carrier-protein] dehydratase